MTLEDCLPETFAAFQRFKSSLRALRTQVRLDRAQLHLDKAHAIYLQEERFGAMFCCLQAMTEALKDPE